MSDVVTYLTSNRSSKSSNDLDSELFKFKNNMQEREKYFLYATHEIPDPLNNPVLYKTV